MRNSFIKKNSMQQRSVISSDIRYFFFGAKFFKKKIHIKNSKTKFTSYYKPPNQI